MIIPFFPDMNDYFISFHFSDSSDIDSIKRSVWNITGPKQLERAEKKILETLKSHFDGRYVPVLNNTHQIWTLYSNLTSDNIPIVLVHGFGGGVGLWSLTLDQLCSDRPVYAIDLPGFARSSRPVFSLDSIEAEKQFIDMLEEWRIGIGLNKEFILLGHSFGGYLSTSYTINYPKYVKQLVLIDPWGFEQKPENIWETGRLQRIPKWLRTFSPILMKISPLTILRATGPLGVPVMKHVRSDLCEKFKRLVDDDRILIYLFHCNAQLPTGETAFRTISDCFAWAKEPMIERIHLLDERIPIYFLHGEQSWVTMKSSLIIQEIRENTFVETIKEAGHHIYADAPEEFEMYLKRTLYNNSVRV
ncbi:unnamed protein product [Rotaria sp. Silwood1]|nr:unnamed protein product [Rotaria sp. Silwood1]CAF4783296.1 unnamed protein product [Rotaria sp. Silwood1]